MPREIEKTNQPRERATDRWVRDQLVALVSGSDAATKTFLEREIRDFAADLAGSNPSPIERVLSEAASLAWVSARVWQGFCIEAMSQGTTFANSEHCQRRAERAHRQFLSTLKTLAEVRRLARRSLQLNVASQQINVAHSAR